MSVYEVHLGSWKRHPGAGPYSYDDLVEHLVPYVVEMGFTHVEFLPVMEHPFGGSWGYQVTSYYAPTSRFGDPDGFRRLVDALHNAGIGVIIDWVPAHFPKDDFALARFDGTAALRGPQPEPRRAPRLGHLRLQLRAQGGAQLPGRQRAVLARGVPHRRHPRRRGGLDDLPRLLPRGRASGSPTSTAAARTSRPWRFLQEINATVYKRVPGAITIAEESTSWPGVTKPTDADGLGFGFKWNMGWMHDSLEYVAKDPVHRSYHHHQLTFAMVYAYSENYVLPISHDEVVHGKGSLLRKMPGDRWQQLANVRAFLSWQWAHPGKQLLFMGQEFAQDNEWAEQRELDWGLLANPGHAGVQPPGRRPQQRLRRHPGAVVAGHRARGLPVDRRRRRRAATRSPSSAGAPTAARWCASATSPAVPHENYRIGLPFAGEWTEVINTDAEVYGGSGVGNLGTVTAHPNPHHGQPASASVRVPPLGTLWLASTTVGGHPVPGVTTTSPRPAPIATPR